jgi:hypothetical protein
MAATSWLTELRPGDEVFVTTVAGQLLEKVTRVDSSSVYIEDAVYSKQTGVNSRGSARGVLKAATIDRKAQKKKHQSHAELLAYVKERLAFAGNRQLRRIAAILDERKDVIGKEHAWEESI